MSLIEKHCLFTKEVPGEQLNNKEEKYFFYKMSHEFIVLVTGNVGCIHLKHPHDKVCVLYVNIMNLF